MILFRLLKFVTIDRMPPIINHHLNRQLALLHVPEIRHGLQQNILILTTIAVFSGQKGLIVIFILFLLVF